jgi:hypothetical protein
MGALDCPVETEHAVADHLQGQKDDGVLVEHEVEGEAEAKELKLFGIFTEGNGSLVDHPQAALTEVGGVLAQERLDFPHVLKALRVDLA